MKYLDGLTLKYLIGGKSLEIETVLSLGMEIEAISETTKLSEPPRACFRCWCREGESNPQGTKYRRILSPLRLPVPPSRHFVEVTVSKAVFVLIHIRNPRQQM
jgi:hypothetical protein